MSNSVKFTFEADATGFTEATVAMSKSMQTATALTAAQVEKLRAILNKLPKTPVSKSLINSMKSSGLFSSDELDKIRSLQGKQGEAGLSAIGKIQPFLDALPIKLSAAKLGWAALGAGIVKVGTALVKALVKAGAELESIQTRMGVLLQDAIKAQNVMDISRDFSSKNTQSFQESAQVSTALAKSGVSVRDIKRLLPQMADIQVGGGDVLELAKLYGEMNIKRQQGEGLTGEDIEQFARAGLRLAEVIQKRDDIGEAEFYRRMENKEYGLKDVDYAMNAVTGPGGMYEGAAQQMADTWNGKMAILKNNWDELIRSLGEGLQNHLKPVIDAVLEWIESKKEDLKQIGSALSIWLGNIVKAFSSFASFLGGFANMVSKVSDKLYEMGLVFVDVPRMIGDTIKAILHFFGKETAFERAEKEAEDEKFYNEISAKTEKGTKHIQDADELENRLAHTKTEDDYAKVAEEIGKKLREVQEKLEKGNYTAFSKINMRAAETKLIRLKEYSQGQGKQDLQDRIAQTPAMKKRDAEQNRAVDNYKNRLRQERERAYADELASKDLLTREESLRSKAASMGLVWSDGDSLQDIMAATRQQRDKVGLSGGDTSQLDQLLAHLQSLVKAQEALAKSMQQRELANQELLAQAAGDEDKAEALRMQREISTKADGYKAQGIDFATALNMAAEDVMAAAAAKQAEENRQLQESHTRSFQTGIIAQSGVSAGNGGVSLRMGNSLQLTVAKQQLKSMEDIKGLVQRVVDNIRSTPTLTTIPVTE